MYAYFIQEDTEQENNLSLWFPFRTLSLEPEGSLHGAGLEGGPSLTAESPALAADGDVLDEESGYTVFSSLASSSE